MADNGGDRGPAARAISDAGGARLLTSVQCGARVFPYKMMQKINGDQATVQAALLTTLSPRCIFSMMRMGGFGGYIDRVVEHARALRFFVSSATAHTDLPVWAVTLAVGTAAALGLCFAIVIEDLESERTGPPAEFQTRPRAGLLSKSQMDAAAGTLVPNDTIAAPAELLAEPPYATWTLFLLPRASHSRSDEGSELSAGAAAAQADLEGRADDEKAGPQLAPIPLPLPRPGLTSEPATDANASHLASPQAPAEKVVGFFEKLFGLNHWATVAAPVEATGRTAVYDISARTLFMPNGERLEAHSGFREYLDDVKHVNVRSRGSTPPNTYQLRLREGLFHGVQAIRLTPVGSGNMYGRAGILAHPYMLGPDGSSNGCVSVQEYPKFLQAFLKGEIDTLIATSGSAPAGPSLEAAAPKPDQRVAAY